MEEPTLKPDPSEYERPIQSNNASELPDIKGEQLNSATVESLGLSVDIVSHPIIHQLDGNNYKEWWVPVASIIMDNDAPVIQSILFLRQPDGTYDMITMDEPMSTSEILVREIVLEDGPLIVLTGSNGEVHYNPEDTVTIDIDDDAQMFLVDPGESVLCYINIEGNVLGDTIEISQEYWEQIINHIIATDQNEQTVQVKFIANRDAMPIPTGNLQTVNTINGNPL